MEDSGFFKGGAGADELTEYMGGIPESTCLVLWNRKWTRGADYIRQ